MADWQEKLITINLPDLIKITDCNVMLLASLKSKNLLSDSDMHTLNSIPKEDDKRYRLYEIVKARKVLFPFIEALQKNEQFAVSDILLKGLVPYKPVKFQTTDIFLNDLLAHYNAPIPETTNELHYDLVKKDIPILVNNQVETPPKYYIQRVISRSRSISSGIFKSPGKDVFVIKGLQRFELTELANGISTDVSSNQIKQITAQFILLENDTHFDKICKLSVHPAHFIECSAKQFRWIKSKGSIAKIRNHLCKEHVKMSEEDFVKECLRSDDPICIADTPGMGKSFFLSKLAQAVIDDKNIQLVRFLQLRNFLQILKSPVTKDSVCNAIAEASSIYEVGKDVVVKALNSEDKISYLFFDGFDEVHSEQLSVVGDILRCIRLLKKTRVYTATRLHTKKELEDIVGVLGFNLLPFQENEQVNFLVEFWHDTMKPSVPKKGTTLTTKRLQEFATVCLESLKTLTSKNDRDIAGIPLLCSILARVHQEDAIDYSKDTTLNSPKLSRKTSSIFEMYQVFMNKGFNKISNHNQNKIKVRHDILAVEDLFSEWRGILKPKLLTDGEELADWSFFLPGVVEPGKNGASFVHRTFAEYLVAEFIAGFVYEEQHEQISIWNEDIYGLVGKLLFEDVLAVRQKEEYIQLKIGREAKVTLFEFEQETICYFLNAFGLSKTQAIKRESSEKKTTNIGYTSVSGVRDMSDIESLFTINSQCTHLDWPHLFIFEAMYAGVETTRKWTELLHKSLGKLPSHLIYPQLEQIVVTPLQVAAQRGDYKLFMYLWDIGGFQKLFYEGNEDIGFLLHKCVSESSSDTQEVVNNKIQIVNLILSDSGKIQLTDMDKESWPNIHEDLLEFLTSKVCKFAEAKVHPLLTNTQAINHFAKMFTAAVVSDNPDIGKMLTRLFKNEIETLSWPELFLLASKYANVEMTRQLTEMYTFSVDNNLPVALLKYPGDDIIITPLHVAAQTGNYNSFEYLWNSAGFQQLFIEEHKNTRFLLHQSVSGTVLDTKEVVFNKLQIIKLMLSHKGTRELQTILEERFQHDLSTPVLQPNIHIDLLKFLISKDVQLSYNIKCENPLHIAAMDGNVSVVEFLVKKHPDLLKRLDAAGNTPLHFAVLQKTSQHVKVQLILVASGADIYTVNVKGCNPFVNGMKHGKGLELFVLESIANKHKTFLSAFGGVGLKSLLTNSNLMAWDWDKSLVAVAEYLIQTGATVSCTKIDSPWGLEQIESNMNEIMESVEVTAGLLMRLEEFGILTEWVKTNL